MKSVVKEVTSDEVFKYSTDLSGYKRIIREQNIFDFLKDSSDIPHVIEMNHTDKKASIRMQTVEGKSLREILGMRDEYDIKPMVWKNAKILLQQYIDVEMNLLNIGVLYRDMNLDHILFTEDKAFLVDLESAIIRSADGIWLLSDMRGTWETMAPEEFSGYGELSARTATYRVAIITYIILVGKLPFKRFPHSRSETHHWRMKHAVTIGDGLNKETQRIFKIALSRKQVHRYKDPATFFEKLNKSNSINS